MKTNKHIFVDGIALCIRVFPEKLILKDSADRDHIEGITCETCLSKVEYLK